MIKKFLIFLTVLFLIGCQKNTPENVVFDVNVSALTVKVGTSVSFDVVNTPESVTFYSGEKGNEYRYRGRDTLSGKLELQFTTEILNGTGQNLTIWVASNIQYPLDTNSIKNAVWTEITDRAVLSKGVKDTPSGVIDLSDFNKGGTLILAFKYKDVKRAASQSIVYVRDVKLNKTTPDGTVYNMLDLTNGGWQAVNFLNNSVVWSINATRLYINGGNASSDSNEDWVLSKTLNLKSVKPDVGVVKKGIAESLSSFTYTYKLPGVYTATIVGANNYVDKSKKRIKEFTITVTQ